MSQNVQNDFLDNLKQNEVAVTLFLMSGVKLQGIITAYDDKVLLLRRNGHTQLIYKNSVSTVMPVTPVDIEIE